MPIIEIPLGDWMPDSPSYKNPGCEIAKNVLPTPGGYGPLLSLSGTGDTVNGEVRGASIVFDNSGNAFQIGGTDTRLFTRRGGVVTETTGLSSIGAGEAWDFTQFNDFVIATAENNSPQYLTDVDTDDTWSALTGSPPNAKRCAKVNEFLMLGDVAGVPNRIRWSAFNNPAGSWAISRINQANSADLPTQFGAVQKIVGGRYGLVFQQRAIHRLTYVGPPVVFRSDLISLDRGAIAPFGVVTVGYLTFFLAQDGFYVTNGTAIDSISTRRVNDWFFGDVDQSKISEVHGAVDWQNESIFWAFKSESDAYDRILIYSWALARWSYAEVATGWLVSSTLDGVDIESLDAIYGDLDSVPLSLDSAEFKASDRRLAAFVHGASTSEYSTFTGDPLKAEWQTGEFQIAPGQRVFISAVTPIIDTSDWDMTAQVVARDNRGALTASAAKEVGWGGFAPVRWEGMTAALQICKPTGSWRDATGLRVEYEIAGTR